MSSPSPVSSPSPSSPPPPPSSPSPPSPSLPSPSPSPPLPSPPLPSPPPPSSGTPPVPSPSSIPSSPPPPPPPPSPETPPTSSSPPSPPVVNPPSPSPPGDASSSSPPPPPRSSGSGRESPASRSPPSPPSPPSSSSDSNSTPLVVGLAVGVAVILGIFVFVCVYCIRRKRRKQPHPALYHHYGARPSPLPPLPPPVKGDDALLRFASDQQYGQFNYHNAPPPSGHVYKMPPSPPVPPFAPGPPPQAAHIGGLPIPPVMSSSGASGSSNSGSETLQPPPSPGIGLGFSRSTFTYEELAMATDGFSDANLLGQGGFGYVHRGMLRNGMEVAVKQLKIGSGQGEREFQAEVEIISRVHHRHLVSLVGYCIADGKRLLVYEFVSNNTLEFHLHGKGRPTLDWPTRLKIALDSAKGLAYLHEDCHPKIIHRDIKASNILLDFKFDAKVADFGLAKFASETNTHVSTRVMGTFGYLAPEYASSGKLTDKSDVFSYGVMLLELITGRRPVDSNQSFMDDSLVDWARPLLARALDNGILDSLADPNLNNAYNPTEMRAMIGCAAAAVRHSAKRRPRMSQIVRALEGDVSLEDLHEGVRPGHSSIYGSSYGSTDYDAMQYNEDMKRFRKMALASQGYGSSGYSAPTSEFDQNPSGSSGEGRQTQDSEKVAGRKGLQ